MKRLIIIGILIAIVYVLSTLVTKQMQRYISDAALIMSGVHSSDIRNIVISHYNSAVSSDEEKLHGDTHVALTQTYLNSDTERDLIATIESNATCGTGGCITYLLLKNDVGEFDLVHFSYAVKKLEVENSITNKMHDLRINDDSRNLMKWNGEQYTLNTI